jgi:Holliday junction resolvase RusA-like endonuclease
MPSRKGKATADGAEVAWCVAESKRLHGVGLAGVLVLPVPPSLNSIWRRSRHGGMYKIEAANAFDVKVHAILRELRVKPLSGPVAASILWMKAGGSGDADNRTKCLFDALKKKAFGDDKDVACYRMERIEGAPKAHVRVMLYPWPVRLYRDWIDIPTEVA